MSLDSAALSTTPAPQKLMLFSNQLSGSFPANWTLPRSLQDFRLWYVLL